MRYKNLIISDDLDMKALTKNYTREEIPVLAMQAGCDILLYCNEPSSPPIGLEQIKKAVRDKTISEAQVNESLKRVTALKKEFLTTSGPIPLAEASKLIGHPEHIRLAKSIAEGIVPEDLKVT
jgi:beta-N-acetylhexosaminidase